MKLVNALGQHDSGAACVATICEIGIRDVYGMLGYDPNDPLSPITLLTEVESLLWGMGKPCRAILTKEYLPTGRASPVRLLLPTAFELQRKLGVSQVGWQIALVGARPTKSFGGLSRFILCRRGEAFDPLPSGYVRYIGSAKSLPVRAAIFLEEAYGAKSL